MLNTETCQNITKYEKLQNIKSTCESCQKCVLAKTRTNVVFAEGNPDAKIILIGEAPGQNEDLTGKPFVGRAGQHLNKLMEAEGLSREENVYICNIIKCRPPENRVPTNEEISSCKGYLEAQIEAIKPSVIILCGATAVKTMLNTKTPISKIRGEWFESEFGAKFIPIFHPSYLLRNRSTEVNTPTWLTMQDLKKIKSSLD